MNLKYQGVVKYEVPYGSATLEYNKDEFNKIHCSLRHQFNFQK